jgi:3-oxoadipate enol-lactonase
MPFFLNHHNLDIYYEVINNEKDFLPLIFVHGWGSSFSMFQYQISLLRNYYKLILFDAEGHGKSQKPKTDIYENLIENIMIDLETLLDLLEIHGEFGIICHSLLGSGVALRYTIKNPSRVKFLILLNGGFLELDSTIRNVFWNLLPQFTRINFYEIAKFSLPILIEKTAPFILEAIKPIDMKDPKDIERLGEKIQDDIENMIDAELNTDPIQCPILLIGAELDNFAPAFLSKGLWQRIPAAEFHIIAMTGHFGPSQRYREYNKFILRFLKKYNLIEDEKNDEA